MSDGPDNGPVVIPPPRGPSPTTGYEYVTIPPQPPILPNATINKVYRTPYQVIETELFLRGANGDIRKLSDGTILYRIPIRDLWKLQQDSLGPFIQQDKDTIYRLGVVDPSEAAVSITEWTPIGA